MRRTRFVFVFLAAACLAPAHGAIAEPASVAARSASDEDVVPRGPSVDERLATIQRRVQAVLVYPPLARLRRSEGTARLAFEIGADGRARGVAVAHSSGFAALDRAALRAVRSVDQLPYVYGRLEIPVRFELAAATPVVSRSN